MANISTGAILAAAALVCVIIAAGCTGGSRVQACPFKRSPCTHTNVNIKNWQHMGNNMRSRYFIFSAELLVILLTLILLAFRFMAKPRKQIFDLGILGVCIVLCLICAGLETWFASGDAYSFAERFTSQNIPIHYMAGSWAAAAAFLWLAAIIYVVDLFFVMKK